jgi:hypothetical protein
VKNCPPTFSATQDTIKGIKGNVFKASVVDGKFGKELDFNGKDSYVNEGIGLFLYAKTFLLEFHNDVVLHQLPRSML